MKNNNGVIFLDYTSQLNRIMDYSVAKRDTISNNIANQNTPNYKAQRVRWEDALNGSEGLRVTNSMHISSNKSEQGYLTQIDNGVEVKSNGNSVDMNKEIVEMMKNNQVFSMAVQALNSNSKAKSAARGS